MSPSLRNLRWPLALFALTMVTACKDDPKPSAAPASSAPKLVRPATTLPDLDMMVDFGAEGGAPSQRGQDPDAAMAAAAPSPEGAAPAAATASVGTKLLDAGAEPRSPARYEFAIDKAQTTLATVRMSAEGALPPGAGQQPPLKLTLRVTPKAKDGAGRVKFTLQVTKAEIVTGGAPVPPEAKQEIKAAEAAITSLSGTFNATPRGDLSDLKLGGAGAPPELTELLAPMVELLFAPLPEEPIGVGAKWTTSSPGAEREGSSSTFTMTARSATGAEITVDTARSAPPQPVPDPRAPEGATMQLDGKGKTKMKVRFDGIASKVEGDSKTKVTIKDPSSTPPRTQTNTIVVKHSLEPVS